MMSQRPTVYVIAGPNGAGKTTFAREYLPKFAECGEFVNADLIAEGLSPFNPEGQRMAAGRLMLERIRELSESAVNFGFETTLAGKSYAKMLREIRGKGHRIALFFLWLPNQDMAVSRVGLRVRQGGHHVPEPDVRRRYIAGWKNFLQLYRPIVDGWWLFDASSLPPEIIAENDYGKHQVVQEGLYRRFEGTQQEGGT